MSRVVEITDLKVYHRTPHGPLRAVDGVTLHVDSGETLGLVGESGCGKSTLARCIVGINRPSQGTIALGGQGLGSGRADRLSRARAVQMVFQDPSGSLNPRLRVGRIIAEPLIVHRLGSTAQRQVRVEDIAAQVGLTSHHLDRFPHELSGGQRQRVSIARALALEPGLLVCDEAVSALDVSVQAQVLNLLLDVQDRLKVALLFISHDLSVVRYVAHRIAVMYLGRIVEVGPADAVWKRRAHPYTRALTNAIPDEQVRRDNIELLEGDVPSPINPPSGCPFRTRCPFARARCAEEVPQLRDRGGGLSVACHFAEEIEQGRTAEATDWPAAVGASPNASLTSA